MAMLTSPLPMDLRGARVVGTGSVVQTGHVDRDRDRDRDRLPGTGSGTKPRDLACASVTQPRDPCGRGRTIASSVHFARWNVLMR